MRKILLALAFFLLSLKLVFGATPISSCGVISSSGSYYLTNNLEISSGDSQVTCLNISADDVIIDLNGYRVKAWSFYWGSHQAILLTNVSNVTIKNGIIDGGLTTLPSVRETTIPIWENGYFADYVTLENITFIGTTNVPYDGGTEGAISHSSINHLTIRNSVFKSPYGFWRGYNIWNCLIEGNTFENVFFYNYVQEEEKLINCTIRNNTINHFWESLISLENCLVEYNFIYDTRGINWDVIDDPIYRDSYVENTIFRYNFKLNYTYGEPCYVLMDFVSGEDTYKPTCLCYDSIINNNVGFVFNKIAWTGDVCPTCDVQSECCGQGVCDAGEDYSNCCVDCGCPEGYECILNSCKLIQVTHKPVSYITFTPNPSLILLITGSLLLIFEILKRKGI